MLCNNKIPNDNLINHGIINIQKQGGSIMNWYWYWQILMEEVITTLAMYSIIGIILAILLKMLSLKLIYDIKISNILKQSAEFLSMAGTLIAFTGLFSAFIERMYLLLGVSAFLVFTGLATSIWIENK